MFFDGTMGDWPVYNPNGRPPNWLTVFNQSVGLASQAISAWGGNPSTQIGQQYSGGVFTIQGLRPVYDDRMVPYANSGTQIPMNYGGQPQNVGSAVGRGVGSGIDAALAWATSNPMFVIGTGLALYLLFKEPPRRR